MLSLTYEYNVSLNWQIFLASLVVLHVKSDEVIILAPSLSRCSMISTYSSTAEYTTSGECRISFVPTWQITILSVRSSYCWIYPSRSANVAVLLARPSNWKDAVSHLISMNFGMELWWKITLFLTGFCLRVEKSVNDTSFSWITESLVLNSLHCDANLIGVWIQTFLSMTHSYIALPSLLTIGLLIYLLLLFEAYHVIFQLWHLFPAKIWLLQYFGCQSSKILIYRCR